MNYTDFNSKIIDKWVEDGWEWGIPITNDEFAKACHGEWKVLLTPNKQVPKDWFPNLKGCKVLGLASGGGQQMPIFAALGADCTVLDYSEKQLENDRMVSNREGLNFAFDEAGTEIIHALPFNPLKDKTEININSAQAFQFSHTIEEQIRGQLKAGFSILDLYEDTNKDGKLHDFGIPTFWATLALKK